MKLRNHRLNLNKINKMDFIENEMPFYFQKNSDLLYRINYLQFSLYGFLKF